MAFGWRKRGVNAVGEARRGAGHWCSAHFRSAGRDLWAFGQGHSRGRQRFSGSCQELHPSAGLVQQNYAVPVDTDHALYQGAIPGMLRVLDPHSNFFDARQFSLLREEQRGKYYGVGMTVAPREGRTVVLAPFVGSPAYKAGIRPGDVITKVDDKPTAGLNTAEVADLLKGPKGTPVRITVGPEGYPEPIPFPL